MSNISLFQTKYTTIDNLENLSQKLQEPEWILKRRKDAFTKFNELPYDQDTLFYKYTNFRKLNPENLTPMWQLEEQIQFPESDEIPTSIEFDASIKIQLDSEMQDNGVIFTSLNNLIKNNETLAQKIIKKIDNISEDFDKLGLLARAFASNSMVLYVPKGVTLEKPIVKEVYNSPGSYTFMNRSAP